MQKAHCTPRRLLLLLLATNPNVSVHVSTNMKTTDGIIIIEILLPHPSPYNTFERVFASLNVDTLTMVLRVPPRISTLRLLLPQQHPPSHPHRARTRH